jgi:branched-chain amino acid aminotransferase
VIRPLLLHNGHLLPSSELTLSPGQVGLLSGWGVFSTIKIIDGVLFAFERHWARMRRDADLLRTPFPWSPAELEEMLLPLVEANGDANATLRVSILRNKGTMWVGAEQQRDVDLVACTSAPNERPHDVRLGIVPNARFSAGPFSGAKILSWAPNLVWAEEAHARGLDEVLLLNERGEIAECTSANVFAVYGDTVATPPLRSGCLPGITRELLLEQVHVPGLPVVERTLTLDDLETADGLFITSTTRDLLSVREVEGLAIRQEHRARPALEAAFATWERAYVANAPRRAHFGAR